MIDEGHHSFELILRIKGNYLWPGEPLPCLLRGTHLERVGMGRSNLEQVRQSTPCVLMVLFT